MMVPHANWKGFSRSIEREWSVEKKDELENRLRGLVCLGALGVGEAQREIAVDWIES
jgi:hypothetical protein